MVGPFTVENTGGEAGFGEGKGGWLGEMLLSHTREDSGKGVLNSEGRSRRINLGSISLRMGLTGLGVDEAT